MIRACGILFHICLKDGRALVREDEPNIQSPGPLKERMRPVSWGVGAASSTRPWDFTLS
jgi:hypothetical protein